MEALISIANTSGERQTGLTELVAFLEGERDLRGWLRPFLAAPVEGELGGAVDVLALTLGSGGVGVSLTRALTSWLQNQRSDVHLKVTVGDRTVELNAQRVADVPALLEGLIRNIDGH